MTVVSIGLLMFLNTWMYTGYQDNSTFQVTQAIETVHDNPIIVDIFAFGSSSKSYLLAALPIYESSPKRSFKESKGTKNPVVKLFTYLVTQKRLTLRNIALSRDRNK